MCGHQIRHRKVDGKNKYLRKMSEAYHYQRAVINMEIEAVVLG